MCEEAEEEAGPANLKENLATKCVESIDAAIMYRKSGLWESFRENLEEHIVLCQELPRQKYTIRVLCGEESSVSRGQRTGLCKRDSLWGERVRIEAVDSNDPNSAPTKKLPNLQPAYRVVYDRKAVNA